MEKIIHGIGRYASISPPKHTVFKTRKLIGFICQYRRKQILSEETLSTALEKIPKEPPSVVIFCKTADSVQWYRVGLFLYLHAGLFRCRGPP